MGANGGNNVCHEHADNKFAVPPEADALAACRNIGTAFGGTGAPSQPSHPEPESSYEDPDEDLMIALRVPGYKKRRTR